MCMRSMLRAAEALREPLPPGKNPQIARHFREVLEERARSEHAIRATLVAIDSPGPGPDCPGIHDLDELLALLPADNCSVLGVAHPALALHCQAVTGSELVLDLVYDRRRKRRFALTTRGVIGGAFSDIAFWLGFSPDFVVLPCLHTHPNPRNELGCEMPSVADYCVQEGVHRLLGGACTCDRIYFPSGRHTLYGVDAQGEWYYRQIGDERLHLDKRDWLPTDYDPIEPD